MSTDLEAVATRIMRLCNESSECPFCGNDDGEHDDTQLCADLDKALNPALPSPSGEELVERVALRPAVAWFAEQMELALRRNESKGTWEECDTGYLWDRLTEEKRELRLAIDGHQRHPDVTREAADVANFAMMIADAQSGDVREPAWFLPAIGALPPSGALGLAQSERAVVEAAVALRAEDFNVNDDFEGKYDALIKAVDALRTAERKEKR